MPFDQVRRRLGVAVAAGVIVAGSVAAAAGAARLGWDETAKNGKTAVMTFRFETLTLGASSWSAEVSIKNVSDKTITVGDDFGVEVFANRSTVSPAKGLAFGRATSFTPPRPTVLKSGATWSGVIGGSGKPPKGIAPRYLRLITGPFSGVPGQKGPIVWVSNHSLKLSGTGAPLPTA